jgi:hypothetical protein
MKFTYIDYTAAAKQREDLKPWLHAKAEQRRLSDSHGKV